MNDKAIHNNHTGLHINVTSVIKGFQQTLVKAHKPNIVCLNINVNSVRIKQFKHQISPHINQVNMNESNINVTSVIIKHWIKVTNKGAQQVSSWWFIYSLYFWTIKNIIWLFRHTACLNVNSVIMKQLKNNCWEHTSMLVLDLNVTNVAK